MIRYYLHPTSIQVGPATWKTGSLLLALGAFRPRRMRYYRNQPQTYSFALNGRTTAETLQAGLDASLNGYYWQVRNLAEDRATDKARR